MRIAPATPAHLPFVLGLSSATLESHRARNPRAFPPKNKFGLIDLHKAAIACPVDGPWTFLAWSDSRVEGYVTIKPLKYMRINPLKSLGMIYDICVLPEARGKGTGHLLLDHALVHARERDWNMLLAIVWDGNDASHRLFQKADFIPGKRNMLARFVPSFRSTTYIHDLLT